jgi:catechol 2,3-dioxygenase-like lactoylglutathione lyase family enzyme
MPVLTHVCLFTNDVSGLAAICGTLPGMEPLLFGDAYAELHTPGSILSLHSVEAQSDLAPGSATAGSNGAINLEFLVDDVDAEYDRVVCMGRPTVKNLTTQDWGNRSFYFRHPDGNLVNFYAKAEP